MRHEIALIAQLPALYGSAMSILGPPNRGNDPLHVFAMAAALVAAAVVGAALGFLIDMGKESPKAEAAQDASGTAKGSKG